MKEERVCELVYPTWDGEKVSRQTATTRQWTEGAGREIVQFLPDLSNQTAGS